MFLRPQGTFNLHQNYRSQTQYRASINNTVAAVHLHKPALSHSYCSPINYVNHQRNSLLHLFILRQTQGKKMKMCRWILGDIEFLFMRKACKLMWRWIYSGSRGELSGLENIVSCCHAVLTRSAPGWRPTLEVIHQNKSNTDIKWTPVLHTLGQKFSQVRR